MSDLSQKLQNALGPRYRVQRELGQGGMAVVYLAEDLQHSRSVAIKVLRPELAVTLGADRFLSEIQLTASLNHPHILPLLDSGTAEPQGNGARLFWFAMPLMQGESLRTRLDREKQLAVEEAVRVAREVADALGYAHTQGIVHRDIKPENILLQAGHALVADFGIARAIDRAGGARLTETGLSIGTPAYMSPQQGAGEAVDARADIYSLGCVLYEMLAGVTPFTGPTAQAIMARHSIDQVPPLRTLRPGIPATVEAAIAGALAKVPADRFATTSEFVAALGASAVSAHRAHAALPSRRVLAGGITVIVVVIAMLAAVRWWPSPAPPLDRGLVAVVPFRVAGNDPSLAYLREGMMDLMATKLNGDAGPRAVDPRFVMRQWNTQREDRPEIPDGEVLEVARRLGAGRAILGSIIGTPGRLVLSASVLDVETGRTREQSTVDGSHDSLPWLVDRLTAELLALDAGMESQRLTSLTSASLPAVREYLNGRTDARAGRWRAAIGRFNQALSLDSTFALAAMNLAGASRWVDMAESKRGNRLAWAARDRLSLRDRSLLEAQLADGLRSWQEFVDKSPTIPEGWSQLGDAYYHMGPLLGVADAPGQALAAFRRAIALDPDTTGAPYAEPMMHLAVLSLATGDTAGTVRLLARLLAADSTGDYAAGQRLALAQLAGDTAMVTQLRRGFSRIPWRNLFTLIYEGQQYEIGIPNAQPALDAVRTVDNMPQEARDFIPVMAHGLAMNRGRPGEAWVGAYGTDFHPRGRLRARLIDAVYWGGDPAAASAVADSLARLITAPPPSARDQDGHAFYYDICVLEQWRLANENARTVMASIARLRAAARDSTVDFPDEHERCADLLEAWHAVLSHRPDALQRLLRLDSLQIHHPAGVTASPITASNLIMARLWRIRGDWARAEAAARRRYTGLQPEFLSTHLLEEGRAAAQAGHREAAIRALRHYLALRYDPEPAVRPEVEQVRAELAALLGEPRDR